MPHYAIGDIQGCAKTLDDLLTRIHYRRGRDRLWLAGDLVNRGPDSLAVLRWAVEQGDSVQTVLGNHDLHLLAVAAGAASLRGKDTLAAILEAPDRDDLLHWLRLRPLFVRENGFAFVHAGLHPKWSWQDAADRAMELERVLQGRNHRDFFEHMYGSDPTDWNGELEGWDRLRVIVNVFTRMRFVSDDGTLDFRGKGAPADAPAGYRPWYEVTSVREPKPTLVTGHWSALGLLQRENVIALDTGCVWGGPLTALRLDDRAIIQAPCLDGALPLDE